MSVLSAIDAIREGRELFPTFVSGKLAVLIDSAGHVVHRLGDKFVRAGNYLDAEGKISCGSSCLLGAQALGMGFTPAEVAEGGALYFHPDVIANEDLRAKYPRGFFSGEPFIHFAPGDILLAKYPCTENNHAESTVPDIIAHLNDSHDPRTILIVDGDEWPETRIVAWLRNNIGIVDNAPSF